jgi:thiamine-phosphate pyrophosphorylase
VGLEDSERLYLITDGSSFDDEKGLVDRVASALAGGVRLVQLREKELGGKRLLSLARVLREKTRESGCRLIINDRVDVALLSGADGVHIGQSGMSPVDVRSILGPGRLIGVSTHSVKEAENAVKEGADFITFGPVYPTPSKARYGEPVGVGPLKEAATLVSVPVFAIGGVKRDKVKEVLDAGARGAAVISAVMSSADPAKSARELIEEIGKV